MTLSFSHLIIGGALLRIGFFLFGLYQDSHMPVKYTDIDYLVFSDAARYVYEGQSPYQRETYRYTPLLSWMLVPNAWGGYFEHYGKLLFMVCDLLTGILIYSTLNLLHTTLSSTKKNILSSLWLLNPMVITISTRGSSESILTFIIMLSVFHFVNRRYVESAFWLGLAIHFKIYPIIYLPAFMYCLAPRSPSFTLLRKVPVFCWLNKTNLVFFVATVSSMLVWNYVMYYFYGYDFLYHSYFYHLTRLDHRHNFSVYNVVLYYKSAAPFVNFANATLPPWLSISQISANIEKFAFVPQLALSAIFIPLSLAQEDICSCLFVQTFAFVTFNKVMTSQYFIWFLIFLPFFLARSDLVSKTNACRGGVMLIIWVFTQCCWLYSAYKLEFLGESTFNGGLFYSSVSFFLANCWLVGQFVEHF